MAFSKKNSSQRPSRRDARSSRSSESRRATRAGQDASSYSRASYSSRSSRRSAGAQNYSAGKYGSSTRSSASAYDRSQAGYVPSSVPGVAGSGQYGRDASRAEYARAQQKRRKKARRKRVLLVFLAVFLVGILGAAGAAWAYLAQIESNMHQNVDEDLLNSLSVTDSASDPFYMLLIGVDKDEARSADEEEFGGSFRTDSMILTRVDPKQKTVAMISIPRDTKVTIDGYGTQKINASYTIGGPAGAVKAVEDLADVKISHYAEVDMDGFAAVVDAVGGVEVNVEYEINDPQYTGYLAAGQQTLNGEQALIYVRSRHAYDNIGSGDLIRSANQRTFLTALMKKIMSSDVATMTSTVSTLSQYVTTDFSAAGIVGLAQSMIGIDVSSNVWSAGLPTTSVYEDDLWYEEVNKTEWKAMMKRVNAGLSPTEESEVSSSGITMSSAGEASSSEAASAVSLSGVSISVKNGTSTTGLAAAAAEKLTPHGATVQTGNANSSTYDKTVIVYNDASNKATAEKIADALGQGEIYQNQGNYLFDGDFLVVVGSDWK